MPSKTALVCLVACAIAISASAAEDQPAATSPAEADADFAVQGEYTGEIHLDEDVPVGVQVIALGGGKFQAVGYRGGLPGDGWDGSEPRRADGETKDGTVRFSGETLDLEIQNGRATILEKDGTECGRLKKVERKSKTLGLKPPEGAVVLFDGTTANRFEGGRLTDDGLLMQGATSRQKFQSFTLHLEFMTPYMPAARGQARGNSGVYLQGRYETQILDSFGLEGKYNECGGLYEIREPDVNMCFPPLSWQTYDIEFTAARYEGETKVADARVTVQHNGVTIHRDVPLPRSTRAAPVKEGPEPGPVYLQDHGNPVRFRNVWIVEK